MQVYVQNKDREALMPCKPAKAKHLLIDGKAEVIKVTPFTIRLNLPKSHYFDAIAICNPKKINRLDKYYKRICIPRGRYQLSKGIRSERMLPKGKVFGFKQWDKVKIGNQIGFIKGKRSSGYFDVCGIDNNTISHSIKYTNLQRLYSKNIMEVEAIPPTLKSMGILA